LMGKATI